MRAIQWILGNRLLVLAVAATLAIAGGVAWTRLPIDAFPDVTNTQVMVLAKAPGWPPWTWSPASASPSSSTCAACRA